MNHLEDMKKVLKKDELVKWIMTLFAANNNQAIRGKVLLTKQVFLLVKEIEPTLEDEFTFFPYQYGPYSTELAKRINRLLDVGWLKSEKKAGSWMFSLSPSGLDEVDEFKKDLNISEDKLQRIDEMKFDTSKMSLKRLIASLYTKYPEYGIDSRHYKY